MSEQLISTIDGKSLYAKSAASAGTASQAVSDSEGNAITGTYATKNELTSYQPSGNYMSADALDGKSANWDNTYTTVSVNSANWGKGGDSTANCYPLTGGNLKGQIVASGAGGASTSQTAPVYGKITATNKNNQAGLMTNGSVFAGDYGSTVSQTIGVRRKIGNSALAGRFQLYGDGAVSFQQITNNGAADSIASQMQYGITTAGVNWGTMTVGIETKHIAFTEDLSGLSSTVTGKSGAWDNKQDPLTWGYDTTGGITSVDGSAIGGGGGGSPITTGQWNGYTTAQVGEMPIAYVPSSLGTRQVIWDKFIGEYGYFQRTGIESSPAAGGNIGVFSAETMQPAAFSIPTLIDLTLVDEYFFSYRVTAGVSSLDGHIDWLDTVEYTPGVQTAKFTGYANIRYEGKLVYSSENLYGHRFTTGSQLSAVQYDSGSIWTGCVVPSGIPSGQGNTYEGVAPIIVDNTANKISAVTLQISHDDSLVHQSNNSVYALGVNMQKMPGYETVLWEGEVTAASGFPVTLSEDPTHFERLRLYFTPWGKSSSPNPQHVKETAVTAGQFILESFYGDSSTSASQFNFITYLTITGSSLAFTKAYYKIWTANTVYEDKVAFTLYKVEGIKRIAGGN